MNFIKRDDDWIPLFGQKNHQERIGFISDYLFKSLSVKRESRFLVFGRAKWSRRVDFSEGMDFDIPSKRSYTDLLVVDQWRKNERIYGEVGKLDLGKIAGVYSDKLLFWSSLFGASRDDCILFFDHLALSKFSLKEFSLFLKSRRRMLER